MFTGLSGIFGLLGIRPFPFSRFQSARSWTRAIVSSFPWITRWGEIAFHCTAPHRKCSVEDPQPTDTELCFVRPGLYVAQKARSFAAQTFMALNDAMGMSLICIPSRISGMGYALEVRCPFCPPCAVFVYATYKGIDSLSSDSFNDLLLRVRRPSNDHMSLLWAICTSTSLVPAFSSCWSRSQACLPCS